MKFVKGIVEELPFHVVIPASKTINFIALLFSLIAVGSISGYISNRVGFLYLPVCCVTLLYVLVGGINKLEKTFIVMYVAFFLSALMSNEITFKPVLRFVLFFIITLLCGPCIYSKRAIIFRALTFRYILILLSILTIGSFFAYFLGINCMQLVLSKDVDLSSSGTFSGFYNHSMMLGPLSTLVSIMFFNAYLISKKKLFIILFFISASGVVLSASRASVLALCVPILYTLFIFKDIKKNKLFVMLFSCLLLSIPVADRITYGVLQKQENNINSGGTFSSRESKWSNRWSEFNESPIFGIGFATVDSKNYEDYTEYSIEPGSTHLSVLSMTGCLGILAYCLVILHSYKAIQKEKNIIALNILCMFIAMIVHATFEGYALFGGSFLCFIYWLVIGQCADYKSLKQQELLCVD